MLFFPDRNRIFEDIPRIGLNSVALTERLRVCPTDSVAGSSDGEMRIEWFAPAELRSAPGGARSGAANHVQV